MTLPPSIENAVTAWLIALPALFSIINPFGASLIFAQATEGRARRDVMALARSVALNSLVILLVSLWGGGWILHFFGISMDALRVTGGLVVAARAWGMLQQPKANEERKERQALQGGRTASAVDLRERAFFPLAMPFTVGPGSISVAIALSTSRPDVMPEVDYLMGISAAATTMAILIAILYSYAERVVSFLGVTGARIVSRLAALILLSIGIQILASGVSGFFVTAVRQALH